MTAKPWFKFHVADFRAEMLLLTPTQRGAYISLLMYYWENEGLPDDDGECGISLAWVYSYEAVARDTKHVSIELGCWI